jgi:hypothetical protein
MGNGPLGVIWQVTVTKVYGRLTWRFVFGGKNRRRGLAMNGKGKGLTVGTDSSYGMGLRLRCKWDKWAQWRVTSRGDGLSGNM